MSQDKKEDRRERRHPDHADARHGVPVADVLHPDVSPDAVGGAVRHEPVARLAGDRPDWPQSAEAGRGQPQPAGPLTTLPTAPPARRGGTARPVTLGENPSPRAWTSSKRELTTILKDPTLPFDQALIKVDPNLKYSELMQVIDVFSELKMNKLSFAERPPPTKGVEPCLASVARPPPGLVFSNHKTVVGRPPLHGPPVMLKPDLSSGDPNFPGCSCC